MHKVLEDSSRALVSLSTEELTVLVQVLTHAAASSTGMDLPPRTVLDRLRGALEADVHESRRGSKLVDVWADGGVMLRVQTTYGDPVEMGETEARDFAKLLQKAIDDVS